MKMKGMRLNNLQSAIHAFNGIDRKNGNAVFSHCEFPMNNIQKAKRALCERHGDKGIFYSVDANDIASIPLSIPFRIDTDPCGGTIWSDSNGPLGPMTATQISMDEYEKIRYEQIRNEWKNKNRREEMIKGEVLKKLFNDSYGDLRPPLTNGK
jgi:hypothetical protein